MHCATPARTWVQTAMLFAAVGLLAACAGPDKGKAADLVANPASMGVKAAWTSSVGSVALPLDIKVLGTNLDVAGTDGLVAAIDGRTGGDLWRVTTKPQLTAGVGSDGRFAAVANRSNELVVLDNGREIWRQKLTASTLTAPFVAGDRVFVLAGDRSVSAFDAASGNKVGNCWAVVMVRVPSANSSRHLRLRP